MKTIKHKPLHALFRLLSHLVPSTIYKVTYPLHKHVAFNTMLSRHELSIAAKKATPELYIRTKDTEDFFTKKHTTLSPKQQQSIAKFLLHYNKQDTSHQRILHRTIATANHFKIPLHANQPAHPQAQHASIIVSCGPAASGKTYVGSHMAGLLGYTYIESDVFHRQSSVDKMKIGNSITDDERNAYIQTLFDAITFFNSIQRPIVVAFPAHSIAVRNKLRDNFPAIKFMRFSATKDEIAKRCKERSHPYIPSHCPDFIANQLTVNTPLTAQEIQGGDIEVPMKPKMKPGELFSWLLQRL